MFKTLLSCIFDITITLSCILHLTLSIYVIYLSNMSVLSRGFRARTCAHVPNAFPLVITYNLHTLFEYLIWWVSNTCVWSVPPPLLSIYVFVITGRFPHLKSWLTFKLAYKHISDLCFQQTSHVSVSQI